MASTKLQRKARRNRVVAKKRVTAIQRLNTKPVIKNVDIEEIKKEFEEGKINRPVDLGEPAEKKTKAKKAAKKEAKKAEAKKSEAKKTEPKKETKKTEAKKAEPKKEAKKAETKKAEPKKAEAKKEETPATDVDVDALLKSVGKAKASDKDDFKEINGIGPAFEKKLNEIGLYTYEQLSKLKKNDIENLGNLEGISADKIESDNWVETAKNLMEAKKGE